MSRIFEAIKKSELQRHGGALPDLTTANEILASAEDDKKLASEVSAPQRLRVTPAPESRLVSLLEKESLAAEKFRFLAVRLRQLQQGRVLNKVLVTSTLPEEGKSFVSANLAATLARRQQQSVLLLEGDLRRPVLSQQLGLGSLPGVSEWLQGSVRQMESVYQLDGAGFWFLPAGRPPENPLELLQSERLQNLMEELAGRFDWIIIDSPPLLPLADTSVWSKLAHGILLVVREGKTEKEQLQRGLDAIDSASLVAVVVNSCTTADHKNYYSRYSTAAAQPQNSRSQV